MNDVLEWSVVVWNLVDAPSTNQSINWTTVAVGLISGLIGISGPWLSLGWQARKESRSVHAAILAEVRALLELVGRQKFGEQFTAALFKASQRDIAQVRLRFPEHYNRVYLANAAKLGVLEEDDARDFVRFYQLMDSLRTDTSEGGYLYAGSRDAWVIESAQEIFSEAVTLGLSLTARGAPR